MNIVYTLLEGLYKLLGNPASALQDFNFNLFNILLTITTTYE